MLREGYRVVSTSSGGRVVHPDGRGVDLTPTEVQLLARASAGGMDNADPALGPLVQKLQRLGALAPLLDVSAEVAAEGGPRELTAPGQPDDRAVVPLFRRDLKIEPSPTAQAVFQVTSPATGRSFSLYDFELSLARMLDGQRRYFEAVDAGQRLGIPVSLESLGQFIRELDGYGFLLPPEEVSSAVAKAEREERRDWDESMRALFQSGLRLTRQGRYAEAASYFEAMLAQDPQTPEAVEMLNRIQQRLGGEPVSMKRDPKAPERRKSPEVFSAAPTLEVPVAPAEEDRSDLLDLPPMVNTGVIELPSEVAAGPSPFEEQGVTAPRAPRPGATLDAMPPPPEEAPALEEEYAEPPPTGEAASRGHSAEDDFFSAEPAQGEALEEEAPTEISPEEEDAQQEDEPAPKKRSRAPWVLLGMGLLAAAGASAFFLLFPEPAGPVPVRGPIAVKPLPVAIEVPDAAVASASETVDAGTPVLDAGVVTTEPADAGAATVAIEASPPPPPVDEKPSAPEPSWTEAAVTKRTRAVRGKLKAPAAGVVTWTVQANRTVKKGEVVGRILKKPDGAVLRGLRASAAGLFQPKIAEGRKAKAGQLIAAVVSPEVVGQARVRGPKPRANWRCEVSTPRTQEVAPCRIQGAVAKGKTFLVSFASSAPWLDRVKAAQLRIAPPR